MESDWGGWAEWGPPITVFVAALALGWISVVRMRPRQDASIDRESRRLDLESARDEAIAALKQLELDRDKLPADEYARERERLLRRGARALEALENPDALPGRAAAASQVREVHLPSPAAGRAEAGSGPLAGLAPEWRGALYALAAVVLLMILWNFAGDIAKPKDQGMGAGQDPRSERAAQVRESPIFKQEVAEQEALLKANPNDLGALNQLTYLWLMMADDPQTAFGYNEQALKVDPKNFDARSYRAVLTAMMGMSDRAVAMLDEVLTEQPGFEKAIIYRAFILLQMPGRRDEAIASLQTALQANPTSQELQRALMSAQSMPMGPPGAAGAQGGPPPASGGEPLASGTVTLAPGVSVPPGAILFLSITNPAGGPPVAAERHANPTFPLNFDLSTADIQAMPGAGGIPNVFDVKARIDLDGNAMTKEAAPIAIVTGVSKGATGLSLALSMSDAPVAAPPSAPGGLLAPLPGTANAPAPGPAELLVSGTANLEASMASLLKGTEAVFVSVRDPAGGPPLAAVKLAPKFPLEFRVTSADIVQMAGPRPVPESFNVTVRIDTDGNAMTKEAAPEAMAQGVKKGTSALQLNLE